MINGGSVTDVCQADIMCKIIFKIVHLHLSIGLAYVQAWILCKETMLPQA